MSYPRQHNERGLWEGIPLTYLNSGYSYENPLLSKNGKYLGYLMSSENGTQLFVLDLDTKIFQQLTFDTPLSTGTPYGGGRFCFSYDCRSIIFSSRGKLFDISVEGGLPRELHSKDLSYNPFDSEFGLVFSVEHKNNMSLGIITDDWGSKIKINADFVYDAVVNVNGDIAVHTWSFPNMSWNGSNIILLEKENNWKPKIVAGGDTATSQPKFSPNGKYLSFHNDQNGWLNLWIASADGTEARALVNSEEEHAYSTWITGMSNYVWTDDSEFIIYTKNIKGFVSIAAVHVPSGKITDFELEKGNYSNLSLSGNKLVVYYEDHKTKGEIRLYHLSFVKDISITKYDTLLISGIKIPENIKSLFSKPEEISYPTQNGSAHALIYIMSDDESNNSNLPVIFLIHGGPTGMTLNRFHNNIQYFVSRGWAVVAINHRGSVGYGREYRECMNENWGVYDVEDTVAAHKYLLEKNLININKTVIMGGSAGGYTTLMVMANHPDLMTAGVNLFGVSDLLGLSEETHFLESQYDTTLIGSLPQESKKFYERSPVNIADNIIQPLLILQGADDPVVLKNQSDRIAKLSGGYVEYKVYDGEGHGFRKKDTIEDMYKRIDKFLRHKVIYR